eukprot:2278025-Amphidinium_carterae.1
MPLTIQTAAVIQQNSQNRSPNHLKCFKTCYYPKQQARARVKLRTHFGNPQWGMQTPIAARRRVKKKISRVYRFQGLSCLENREEKEQQTLFESLWSGDCFLNFRQNPAKANKNGMIVITNLRPE